jgi:farnesyl-diphosphate farnesyltransferase
MSVALGKIEQFIESIFPASTTPSLQQIKLERERAERQAGEPPMKDEDRKELYWIYAAIGGMWILLFIIMSFVAWLCGARFDSVFADVKDALESFFGGGAVQEVMEMAAGRVEL